MEISICASGYDVWISDEENFDDEEDLAWFKEECDGLSREDLFRILARAKEIAQEYKLTPSEIEKLAYDTGGGWYIHFDDGRESIYREDQFLKEAA